MKKQKIPLTAEISADVMFASDSTCCKCNDRGKSVQIHHIDQDRSNNDLDNLCVLCFQCHDEAHIRGGFGKRLTADLVCKYRDEWLYRVKTRRHEADRMAISQILGIPVEDVELTFVEEIPYSENRADRIIEYVNSLPDLKKQAYAKAELEWDSGVSSRMNKASYDYAEALEVMLLTLAGFYAPGSFGGNIHRFISEQIASRYRWHRSYSEPNGTGTRGTIVNQLVAGSVMHDLEGMVKEVAIELIDFDDRVDWTEWLERWRTSRK